MMIMKKEPYKTNLSKEFEMKHLSDLKYFLEIEVLRSKQDIFLSQQKYTLDLLKEIISRKRHYVHQRNNFVCSVEGYTDANWVGSVDDRRSTTGYLTFVGGNLFTWRSKKQSVLSRSSAEVEYRGMVQGVCKLLWIKNLLHELRVSYISPMRLYCNNKIACNIAHNPVQHD
eukprot:XP_015577095.1 uncharacterized protein LOC107261543 [Ricinus communis]